MRIRFKKYSWWEDRMIMKYVNETPDNLSYAFRCAAAHIDRTVKGIEQRYYNHLCHRPNTYNPPQHDRVQEPQRVKERNKLTITLGKYCISISER